MKDPSKNSLLESVDQKAVERTRSNFTGTGCDCQTSAPDFRPISPPYTVYASPWRNPPKCGRFFRDFRGPTAQHTVAKYRSASRTAT